MKFPALLVLTVLSCAPAAHGPVGAGLPRINHYDTRTLKAVQFDLEVRAELVATYRAAVSESLETLVCLYGHRADSTVWVTLLRPAAVSLRTRHAVYWGPPGDKQGCPDDDGFVGSWHTHLPSPNPPLASPIDEVSYWADRRAILLLVGVAMGPDGALVTFWRLRDGRYGYLVWGGTKP